jgi:hypothetical protein
VLVDNKGVFGHFVDLKILRSSISNVLIGGTVTHICTDVLYNSLVDLLITHLYICCRKNRLVNLAEHDTLRSRSSAYLQCRSCKSGSERASQFDL